MDIFVTTMHRWGDVKNHSYITAVCVDKQTAEIIGHLDKNYRCNKYEPLVSKLHSHKDLKTVYLTTSHMEDKTNFRFWITGVLDKNYHSEEWKIISRKDLLTSGIIDDYLEGFHYDYYNYPDRFRDSLRDLHIDWLKKKGSL
jgi:hypothetical protein